MNDSVKQAEICQAIVFDPTGKIMVAASKEDIKILSFENANIKLAHALLGHLKIINCLVFSQIGDYFFLDLMIDQLYFGNPQIINGKAVRLIVQWQSLLNYLNIKRRLINLLFMLRQYNQSLEEKHNSSILSLSLNESERVLASSQSDQIIIQLKALNNQWMFQQGVTAIENISLNNFQVQTILNYIKLNQWYFLFQMDIILQIAINISYRKKNLESIKFLKEDQFIWLQDKSNSLCVFENVDGLYQENMRKRVQLNKSNKFYQILNYFLQFIIKLKIFYAQIHIGDLHDQSAK
ncbi:unnamed protein product [Paramecium octaurelia]|uniref:Uncharacterized protein n=1 Tax=Paramecium octaurelia TaxID=43137 RepID=A0A8S1VYX8_PAROT|nr:unnamed protein product [Paramecium octaurelia]